MNPIKRRFIGISFCGLLLTGCGGYHAGKMQDTVYKNRSASFRLETPDEFQITESSSYEQLRAYRELKEQADERGASDTFVCEYAAAASDCEAVIFSEPNTENDTSNAFLARLCNHIRNPETEFEVRKLEKCELAGSEWLTALIAAHAQGVHDEHEHAGKDANTETDDVDRTQLLLYVKAADDSFVYMLLCYPAGEAGEAQKQMLLDSIH